MKVISVSCKILIIGFWCITFGLVLSTYFPYNPYSPSAKTKLLVQAFIPQGWGFFTKDPREPESFIYSSDGANWRSVLRTPNSSFKNLIGLRRNARAQGAEYGMLLSEISKDSAKWGFCKGTTKTGCIEINQNFKIHSVLNKVRRPTLCGELWLIMQAPVPWAWQGQSEPVQMPIKFIRLNVLCNAQVNN